jgi:hypothetical protein
VDLAREATNTVGTIVAFPTPLAASTHTAPNPLVVPFSVHSALKRVEKPLSQAAQISLHFLVVLPGLRDALAITARVERAVITVADPAACLLLYPRSPRGL